MTIHNDFWRSRPWFLRSKRVRDANRRRCYQWEHETLRPYQRKYDTRQAAKGFARLCSKVAVKRLVDRHEGANPELIRETFKAAFTMENLRRCDAAEGGCYFASWGWSDVIIAHEVAHWADRWDHHLSRQATFEGHGPKWRGWFAFILSDVRPDINGNDTLAYMTGGLRERNLRVVLP